MRKWIVLFLSLLVMAGSLIPCCPADNCQDEKSSMLSSHPEEEQESGSCSPFFTCGTCVGFDHQVRMVTLYLPKAVLPSHVPGPVHSFCDTYIPAFFQPPRFC